MKKNLIFLSIFGSLFVFSFTLAMEAEKAMKVEADEKANFAFSTFQNVVKIGNLKKKQNRSQLENEELRKLQKSEKNNHNTLVFSNPKKKVVVHEMPHKIFLGLWISKYADKYSYHCSAVKDDNALTIFGIPKQRSDASYPYYWNVYIETQPTVLCKKTKFLLATVVAASIGSFWYYYSPASFLSFCSRFNPLKK